MEKFDIILFSGRPGSGKSEVIDFLMKLPLEERIRRYYVADIVTIDDFEFLWEKGEEDDIYEELGFKRLFTIKHPTGYAVNNDLLYPFLIKKINIKFKKLFNKEPDLLEKKTLFIEFSRGGENSYKKSYEALSNDILEKAVAFYVQVSYEESVRKNKKRYIEEAKESILFHSLPDFIMEKYKIDDWNELTREKKECIEIKGYKIPYITFKNEPEITDKPEEIAKQLDKIIPPAYENYKKIKGKK
ncbi:MAG TPA: hypothetical protein PLD27_07440 [bacterium]|nr:hypothetical protein [bacterium]HOL47067.1 hypothetical protein [bacterium]HPQ18967.1 hypothetical protein [bacterium]